MKKMLFLALLLMLTSCGVHYVSLEPIANERWRGKPHAEIVATYGAPQREMDDGNGGRILVYENARTVTNTYSTGAGPVYGGLYGFYYHSASPQITTESKTEVDYAHFYIGADGLCYMVKTNLEKEVRDDEQK